MCLGVPARVIKLRRDEGVAVVDFGGGIIREVDASFTQVEIGDYVIVHAGTIISKVDPEEALESIRVWNEIIEKLKTTE
jgi:hydrogenase expression/formation protein HypC